MEVENIKKEIIKLLGEVSFEGHFDIVVESMNEKQQENFMDWIKRCAKGYEQIAPSKKDKDLIAFFFKPNISNIRGILTKKKASFFIALFLDNHKYYDRERKRLGY